MTGGFGPGLNLGLSLSLNLSLSLSLSLVISAPALAAEGTVRPPAGQPAASGLSEKESFMLMFGKGNGAMRLLCRLERDGVITAAIRRDYAARLEQVLGEAADSASDRRNLRTGRAFAAGRRALCPQP